MTTTGFLGIDVGTQGLSVVFTDNDLGVISTGNGTYEMVSGLGSGCYEQDPVDWLTALKLAMADLRSKLASIDIDEISVLAIGVAGQMHGEVLADHQGEPLGPARLWCDIRNEDESVELTELFGIKIPKRTTAARWLWTTRNRTETALMTRKMTTPAGWLSHQLTGQWNLGIGDASGMFPIDQTTLSYDKVCLGKFDQLVPNEFPRLVEILPEVRPAGQDSGTLNSKGADLLSLQSGIPVAAAEGDQPAALAGSRIAGPGMISVSFGTSVCANSVGDRPFEGVSQVIDHFCAVDGKPINMVFLRNGTTFMNTVVEMFSKSSQLDFSALMLLVLKAAADCGGVLALPFMDDEPGLGVKQGGSASLFGLNATNATAGNCIRAALLATIMNLRIGLEVLADQGFPRKEIVLTGGLTKTPELGQILADALATPVLIPAGGEEGTAVGAAILAKYRDEKLCGSNQNWVEFLASNNIGDSESFQPNEKHSFSIDQMFDRYKVLLRR